MLFELFLMAGAAVFPLSMLVLFFGAICIENTVFKIGLVMGVIGIICLITSVVMSLIPI